MASAAIVGISLLIVGLVIGAGLVVTLAPSRTVTETETMPQLTTEVTTQTTTSIQTLVTTSFLPSVTTSTITETGSGTQETTTITLPPTQTVTITTSSTSQTSSSSGQPLIDVSGYSNALSASFLVSAYKTNQASADNAYTGKNILLIGNVSSVTKNSDGSYSSISPSIQWNWVNDTIASTVAVNSWFLAVCSVNGLNGGVLVLSDCYTVFSSASSCPDYNMEFTGYVNWTWSSSNPSNSYLAMQGKFSGSLFNGETEPLTILWFGFNSVENSQTQYSKSSGLVLIPATSSSIPIGDNANVTVLLQSNEPFPTYNANNNQPVGNFEFIAQIGSSQRACMVSFTLPNP